MPSGGAIDRSGQERPDCRSDPTAGTESVSFGLRSTAQWQWVYVSMGSRRRARIQACAIAPPPLPVSVSNPEGQELVWSQEYNPQRVKAGFQSFPQPTASQLASLTAQVAINGHFSALRATAMPLSWRRASGVQHVISSSRRTGATTRSWRSGSRQWRPNFDGVWPGNHAESAQSGENLRHLDNMMASLKSATTAGVDHSARAPDVIEPGNAVLCGTRPQLDTMV